MNKEEKKEKKIGKIKQLISVLAWGLFGEIFMKLEMRFYNNKVLYSFGFFDYTQ